MQTVDQTENAAAVVKAGSDVFIITDCRSHTGSETYTYAGRRAANVAFRDMSVAALNSLQTRSITLHDSGRLVRMFSTAIF